MRDGTLTSELREVNSLLVRGEPFFQGSAPGWDAVLARGVTRKPGPLRDVRLSSLGGWSCGG
jgi:hypothetical protein